jgi:hypothetical protein
MTPEPTPPPLGLSLARDAAHRPAARARQLRSGALRASFSTNRRLYDWGLSRQARRRNLRLMQLLLGAPPLSRRA